VPIVEAVKRDVGVTGFAWHDTDTEQANAIMKEGKADPVALGRRILVDPRCALACNCHDIS
jgi:2,4-dienoyl-CoA reductase-like NADH-dependent reductase (Old Yellow Enzyme family)